METESIQGRRSSEPRSLKGFESFDSKSESQTLRLGSRNARFLRKIVSENSFESFCFPIRNIRKFWIRFLAVITGSGNRRWSSLNLCRIFAAVTLDSKCLRLSSTLSWYTPYSSNKQESKCCFDSRREGIVCQQLRLPIGKDKMHSRYQTL